MTRNLQIRIGYRDHHIFDINVTTLGGASFLLNSTATWLCSFFSGLSTLRTTQSSHIRIAAAFGGDPSVIGGSSPDSTVHGAHLGPTGPRLAPCWPHEPCYLGSQRLIFAESSLMSWYLQESLFKTMQSLIRASRTGRPHTATRQ